MEKLKQVRRICANCGKEFCLTKSQQRQVKHKWATHCSRTCARITQHKRNHSEKRIDKKCHCGKMFTVTNWDNDKESCSIACSSIKRFGDPTERRVKTNQRINQILQDAKYMTYIKRVAIRIGHKYGIDYEDILQDFFLALSEGQNTTVEHVAMSSLRRQIKRGITGEWKMPSNTFVNPECLKVVKEKKKSLSSEDFVGYIYDLRSVLSEDEFKIVFLAVQGFQKNEVYEKIKGDLSRREFYKIWESKIKSNESLIPTKHHEELDEIPSFVEFKQSSRSRAVYF